MGGQGNMKKLRVAALLAAGLSAFASEPALANELGPCSYVLLPPEPAPGEERQHPGFSCSYRVCSVGLCEEIHCGDFCDLTQLAGGFVEYETGVNSGTVAYGPAANLGPVTPAHCYRNGPGLCHFGTTVTLAGTAYEIPRTCVGAEQGVIEIILLGQRVAGSRPPCG
jgi:hypothetical protein